MQLPPESLLYMRFVRFAYYVAARLDRAREAEWADEARKAGDDVRATGRVYEDKGLAEVQALAKRDAVDDDLDDEAGGVRRQLAAASNDAVSQAPYTQVFPNGATALTDAPLDEEETRYGDFAQRVRTYLPPDMHAVAERVTGKLGEWRAAKGEVAEARNAEGRARTDFLVAHERFERTMERIYGRLIDKYGTQRAERFFPRRQRGPGEDPKNGGGGTT